MRSPGSSGIDEPGPGGRRHAPCRVATPRTSTASGVHHGRVADELARKIRSRARSVHCAPAPNEVGTEPATYQSRSDFEEAQSRGLARLQSRRRRTRVVEPRRTPLSRHWGPREGHEPKSAPQRPRRESRPMTYATASAFPSPVTSATNCLFGPVHVQRSTDSIEPEFASRSTGATCRPPVARQKNTVGEPPSPVTSARNSSSSRFRRRARRDARGTKPRSREEPPRTAFTLSRRYTTTSALHHRSHRRRTTYETSSRVRSSAIHVAPKALPPEGAATRCHRLGRADRVGPAPPVTCPRSGTALGGGNGTTGTTTVATRRRRRRRWRRGWHRRRRPFRRRRWRRWRRRPRIAVDVALRRSGAVERDRALLITFQPRAFISAMTTLLSPRRST